MEQVIAVIADSGNPASAALHRACGFTEAGLLRNVGRKHGRRIDTLLMQHDLTAAAPPYATVGRPRNTGPPHGPNTAYGTLLRQRQEAVRVALGVGVEPDKVALVVDAVDRGRARAADVHAGEVAVAAR